MPRDGRRQIQVHYMPWGLRGLPHQVKTQYLQILNIVDTSIKHQISAQSFNVVKGCMYIFLVW